MAEPVVPSRGRWLIPGYEFVRVLGRGGSGWVALARDLSIGRLVAVKTIHDGGRNAAATGRLRREGRILAGLRHPGIVTVYQLFSLPGSLSLVMEYLPGGNLADAVESGSLSGSAAVSALTQVAEALHAAATAGIVHRDVKPANVLLDGSGRVVLADFGLSRLRGRPQEFRTMSGAITGTPLFMAPEQIEHPELETPAIDAYAFGVMAYWVLTGQYPYRAATMQDLLAAQRSAGPRSPAEVRPDIPRRTSAAILDALQHDPRRRLSPIALAGELSRAPAVQWDLIIRSAHPVRPVAPVQSIVGGQATEQPDDEDEPAEPPPDGTDGWSSATHRILLPEQETWVEPPVYSVPRRRPAWWAPAVGVTIGLLVGLIVFLVLFYR